MDAYDLFIINMVAPILQVRSTYADSTLELPLKCMYVCSSM